MSKVEYEYAGVKYIGLAELALGTNCTKSVLRRRLDSGWSVKDAVEKPVQKRRKELYVYKDVEYSGVVYDSVEDACSSISGLEIGIIRARMLRNQLEFQDAVHDRYYVVDGIPFKLMREMCKYLNISNFSLQKLIKDCTCNDEVAKIALSIRGSLRAGSVAQSLSINLRDASSVTVIGDERYLVYCKCCGRPIILSGDDVRSFKHSDKFCSSHTCVELYENGVIVSQLRCALARYETFEAVVAFYRDADGVSILRRNLNRDSVGAAKLLCNGRYMLIKCAVCNRHVMLPIEDAKLFEHSDLCERYEWRV